MPCIMQELTSTASYRDRPITPVICSEILSHPQAVRDLFEPLRMFTPYDEFAGCDTWVTGVAAPVALFAAIAWGCVKVSYRRHVVVGTTCSNRKTPLLSGRQIRSCMRSIAPSDLSNLTATSRVSAPPEVALSCSHPLMTRRKRRVARVG
jgi:hypothetical protein